MTQHGYFKMPAAQTNTENCVSHNGGLVPVPGRDIMVQGWYQGGVNVFDFTDPARPVEIAYFDRGPVNAETLVMGGSWGAYYWNGYVYSSELSRGLDVLELLPSQHLSRNEIEARSWRGWRSTIRRRSRGSRGRPRSRWSAPTSTSSRAAGGCPGRGPPRSMRRSPGPSAPPAPPGVIS
jgi:hypothetical protein